MRSLCNCHQGIFLWFFGIEADQLSIALLVTGRVIDLLRVFRLFFQHGEIARRIKQAWLCATGPFILLLAAMHCIVHVGVALWRNLIVVGSTQGIVPRYDVQNFNSFPSGMLTIFNIAIGNDWNAIVAVFLTISRPTVVYPFFMVAREISCVLMSVLSAFFIQGKLSFCILDYSLDSPLTPKNEILRFRQSQRLFRRKRNVTISNLVGLRLFKWMISGSLPTTLFLEKVLMQ